MNRHISLRALAIIILLVAGMASAETPNRVTILYDSFGKSPSLTMDWGFAALVEYGGKRILFDTGNNARIFEHNVKAAGVDLQNIDFVIISHRHADHTSGITYVLTVNPKVPSTIDAAALCKMADRGQITGAVIDGPLALDNAISPEAAAIKKIASPVAGRANILVVPDLEAGNMLAKQLTFLAGADAAGVVLGARAPIILTSRADAERTRMAREGQE